MGLAFEEKLREIRRILEGAMDSLSDEDSGTRLGLTIAQTLAEQMRGQLGVESVLARAVAWSSSHVLSERSHS